jgi:uncharacterized protein YbaP (TraB family)
MQSEGSGRGGARRLLAAMATGLVLALIGACSAAAPPPKSAPSPALWRLTDSDSEIWLFGTVHVLPPELKWRSAAVDRAFAAAELVVFETPTDAAAQAQVARTVAEVGRNPAGVTLSSKLPPEDSARLARVARGLGLDAAALEGLRPWLAGLTLSLRYVTQQGHDPDAGVERILDADAAKRGVPRRYFETPESQIRILSDLPPQDELRFLTATLIQIESKSENVDAMDDAWVRGDVATLGRLLTEDIAEAGPETYAALLTRRNARWTDEIDAMMRGRGKIFIAVGSAHLIGPEGVPALLRAKGYKVEGP